MNGHDDLPLFRWRPPECEVIAFPQSKRIGRIRKAAEVIAGSTEKADRAYRRRTTGDLQRQLEAAGVPSLAIEEEVCAFWLSVDREIARISSGAARKPDGGAA